ncbi:MAG: DUF4124 domain-containing protein [Pseudomonadota bacterium]
MRQTLALTALLIALPMTAQATIYKWVDSKGVTHYTETPPPAGQAQELQPRTTAPKPLPAPAAPSAEPAAKAASDKPGAEAGKDKSKEIMTPTAEQMEKQCQDARQRLQQIENSPRMITRGEDGQMRRMPEEERQGMMDEERRRIELYCQ